MATESLRDAAILLSALPQRQAALLLARLEPAQAATLLNQTARLAGVTAEEWTAAIEKFAGIGQNLRPVGVACGNRMQCESATPTQTALVAESPFDFLKHLGVLELAGLLADEHPQTIALILSRLPSQQAAGLIDELDQEQQAEVLRRIAAMAQPSREAVQDVADGLRRRLNGRVARKTPVGLVRAVRMFHTMKPTVERAILAHIAEVDPALLADIRGAILGSDVAACGEWEFAAAG